MEKTNLTLHQAMSIFEDNLDDIKDALTANMLHDLSDIELFEHGDNPVKNELYDDLNRLMRKQVLVDRSRVVKRITAHQQAKLTPHTNSITDADIERAREYPIQELFLGLTGNRPKKGMASCPFHTDDTPSMSLRRYNRYRCFSCDERGDTIDLYMKLNGVNFIQAVKALI